MLVRLNHKVHVLFRRQDVDMVKLEGKVAVVTGGNSAGDFPS